MLNNQQTSFEGPLSAGNSSEALNHSDDGMGETKLKHNTSDSVISDSQYKHSAKKRKPERIKGPHKSRESLGRPTILDIDVKSQHQQLFEGN